MSIYHRYVVSDERSLSLSELDLGPRYAVMVDTLMLDDQPLALIDVTFPGDPIFEGDLDLLRRQAEERRLQDHRALLDRSRALVTVEPLNMIDPLTEPSLEPLWEWLRSNRRGFFVWE